MVFCVWHYCDGFCNGVNEMNLNTIKFILALPLALAANACTRPVCDDTPDDHRWESLPIAIYSDYVDAGFLEHAVYVFNESIGAEVFILDDTREKYVNVEYAELGAASWGGQELGSTNLDFDGGFIDHAEIKLDFSSGYDLELQTFLHELGHAMGHNGHDESGIMYCYTDDVMTESAFDVAFESLRAWFTDNYGGEDE